MCAHQARRPPACNEGGHQHAINDLMCAHQARRPPACNEGGNQHALREATSMQ
jgi:hypothetical protein